MPRRREPVASLAERVRKGERSALARAITLVESGRADDGALANELIGTLLPDAGGAVRIAISGLPGVGKSTFIEAFGTMLTAEGMKLAVLAVDPSSRVTRGSILGDKTRMVKLARDPLAFVRPSPTGGSLGGVARKTHESIVLCEAAGFDVVLVETVGIGQSEAVARDMVDYFVLMLLAESGDELQGIKRGVLELADLLVFNKADGEGKLRAERAKRSYEGAAKIVGRKQDDFVVTCSALEGTGIEAIWERALARVTQERESGALETRRSEQRVRWMDRLIDDRLRASFFAHPQVKSRLASLKQDVLSGDESVGAAVDELLGLFLER